MLQMDKPEDYVLATNNFHSVRDFIELAFSYKNITIKWEGDGLGEIGIDTNSGKSLIRIDKRYYRPTEVDELIGSNEKAKKQLGWQPTISFTDLVKEMVESDCL